MTAKVIKGVIDLALKGVASQFGITVYAVSDDAIFQSHILRTSRPYGLMTDTTMPRFVGIDLIIIVGYRQTVFVEVGVAGNGQTQGYLAWLRDGSRIHQHIPVAVA